MLKAEKFSSRVSLKVGLFFSKIPISPNAWTIISLLPAVAGFYFLVSKDMFYALILFFLASVMDVIDGGVARVTSRVTAFGAYLDGMVDRIVEAFLLFGLMIFSIQDFILPGYIWLSLLLFFGTAMTTFSKAYADHRKAVTDEKTLEKMGGTLERAERLILIFIGMILYFYNPLYLTYVIALGSVLAIFTVLQRALFVRKASKL